MNDVQINIKHDKKTFQSKAHLCLSTENKNTIWTRNDLDFEMTLKLIIVSQVTKSAFITCVTLTLTNDLDTHPRLRYGPLPKWSFFVKCSTNYILSRHTQTKQTQYNQILEFQKSYNKLPGCTEIRNPLRVTLKSLLNQKLMELPVL